MKTSAAVLDVLSSRIRSICDQAIETAKTDENGNCIHEECYVLKVQLERASS